MKRNGFAQLIIIIIAILGMVGYFAYRIFDSKWSIRNSNSSSPASTSNNNFGYYTSSKFGFSLNYQTDSVIYFDSESSSKVMREPNVYLLKLANETIQKTDPNGFFYLFLEIYNQKPQNCLIMHDTSNNWTTNTNIKNLLIKDISVGGVSTKLVNFTGAYDLDYSHICVLKNNLYYNFSTEGSVEPELKSIRDKYFLDVVNSFKFTN